MNGLHNTVETNEFGAIEAVQPIENTKEPVK
jgi:hypothetical protein